MPGFTTCHRTCPRAAAGRGQRGVGQVIDAVLPDTCVLLKSYLRDTLLSIAEVGTFRPLWSDHVLQEIRRNLLKAGAKPEAAGHRLRQMATYFPDAQGAGYEQLGMPGVRPPVPHPAVTQG